MPSRRTLLLAMAVSRPAATALLAACATPTPAYTERPPIVFVHGNGDSAALWQTTIWRFESNGWPRDRLFARRPAQPARARRRRRGPARAQFHRASRHGVPEGRGRPQGAEGDRRQQGRADRQLARRQHHPQLRAERRRRRRREPRGAGRQPGARHLGGEGLPREQRVLGAVRPFLQQLNAPKGRERRRGHAGREMADAALGQQRQVRAARRRVDRRARQADEHRLRRAGAQGRDQPRAAARRPPRDLLLARRLRRDVALPDRAGAAQHGCRGGDGCGAQRPCDRQRKTFR